MSKIVFFHKCGGPEVLQIEDAHVPPPAVDEVQFRVKAIGLNRAEAMFRTGNYLFQPHFPSRLGYEASGIVESIGSGVTAFSPGDIISVVPSHDQGKYGLYGEIANVPSKYVVKHPGFLSFPEAAAIWMQYLTAYGALIDIAATTKDDFVVITAASSSVGLAAIQLCNMVDATPIAITRTSYKKEALLKAGAKHVIASQEENLAERLHAITKGRGVRIVFDPVGGPAVLNLAEAMAPHGILFQYGALSSEPTPFPLLMALAKSLTMRGYILFEIISDAARFEKAKQFVLEGLKNRQLKPIIDKIFPLAQIVEAHRHLESNNQFGKIIVIV